MSANTSIEWTDRSWNPVRGCSRVSPGCDHCYAMGQAHRFNTPNERSPYHGLTTIRRGRVDWSGQARFIPSSLGEPMRWRKPQRIFVNSMSDLFHHDVTNEQIAAVFGVMAACPRHTFQILTKRPERMLAWFNWHKGQTEVDGEPWIPIMREAACWLPPELAEFIHEGGRARDGVPSLEPWPLSNVWLGVSAENQKTADERIPLLLKCPAPVHFVSAEPLLDRIEFKPWWLKGSTSIHMSADISGLLRNEARALGAFAGFTDQDGRPVSKAEVRAYLEAKLEGGAQLIPMSDRCDGFSEQTGCPGHRNPALSWVIVGGESGPGARPFDPDWAHSIVRQCEQAGCAVFVKQLGGNVFAPWKVKWTERLDGSFDAFSSDGVGTRGTNFATVWNSGTWHTWDRNGIGGQNDSEPTVEEAKRAALAALQRQHVQPMKGWAQHAHMLKHRKGGDMSEWPEELRVRQFPGGVRDGN